MQIFGLGLPELIIIAVILLLFFGPKRLPGLFRSLGSSMSEFKKGLSDVENKLKEEPTTTETQATTEPGTATHSTPDKKDTSA